MKIEIESFVGFIAARYKIQLAREVGQPQPWSDDPILQRFKFCNIFRELDRTSLWIAKYWREPNKNDPDFWFASVLARRCINLPATLREIGYPIPWDPQNFLSVLERRKKAGKPIFNSTAYRLILSGQSGDLGELQAELILNHLWTSRKIYRPRGDDTLRTFHDRLAAVRFMGDFYTAQVVADVKYIGLLPHVRDWWTFAASGPGSRRGLNRVLGRPANTVWMEKDWFKELHALRNAIIPALGEAVIPRMHAQDLQNCLCEFDKYERIRLGEGDGRKFTPSLKPLPVVPRERQPGAQAPEGRPCRLTS
jgi:hypothetical protein